MRILRRARLLGLASGLLAMVPLRAASYHVTRGHVHAGRGGRGHDRQLIEVPLEEDLKRGPVHSAEAGPGPSNWLGEGPSVWLPWSAWASWRRTGRRSLVKRGWGLSGRAVRNGTPQAQTPTAGALERRPERCSPA